MNNNTLKMNREEVRNYSIKNQYATMRFFDASNDYVAARCCILNGLFSGFILANQAIEKILKAFIYLESSEKMKSAHDSFKLKEKLKKLSDYRIDGYDTLLKKLYNHYLARYYENSPRYHEDGISGTSSEELLEIDKLWVELIEKLPIPDEVKYRMKFFADLFERNPYWNDRHWITQDNQSLIKKVVIMEERYKEVFQHLYRK